MQTQNIISTPGITGNIGSCTTQSIEVESGRLSAWKIETKTITTNSCTGRVAEFNSWEYTGFFYFIILICGLILWVIFTQFLINYE